MLSNLRGKQRIKISITLMRVLFICTWKVCVNGAGGNLGMHSADSVFHNYRKWELGVVTGSRTG